MFKVFRKPVLLTGVTVIALLAVTGISSSSAATSASKPMSRTVLAGKTIAYIMPGAAEYYVDSAKGAQAAVKALGGTAKVFDSGWDVSKELANVKSAILEKVDGIVLFPLSDASAKAELSLANAANIPMSLLYGYSAENAPNGAGFVQVNFFNYAKALGAAFAKVVPTGKVAIVSGTLGRSEVTAFHDGFVAGFGSPSRVVEEVSGNYSRTVALKATQDLITKYPDLAGLVVGNEDMAIGAVSGLGKKASQVKIATQNGSPEGNAFLRAGKFAMTVGASPSQEAALAVNLLAQTLSGHPVAKNLCQTPWALNTTKSIKSVGWASSNAVISSGLTIPALCSAK